ncbi:hypothetical protein GUJ93_ZPchr0001g32221 [Zizania palustris]|uniref:Cleavage inducing molecular chaperone Jiv domain-containing protein n=1 Tax=Zizania palustris TaxID=103762 RepID=A0A8J5VNS4_ZIZPA|nr:hypothetical protein GUJ93_ZPchr0001g32221 [Zizania palustris]
MDCSQYHQAKDGDGWVENGFSAALKMEIPRAFVRAESKIFDVSEWATCQDLEVGRNLGNTILHCLDRKKHFRYLQTSSKTIGAQKPTSKTSPHGSGAINN